MPQPTYGRRRAKHRRAPQPPTAVEPVDPRVRFGVVPLRLFLAVTFIHAGIQKIADPGFFNAGGSTYIGRQLTGFARTSPIGGLLDFLGQNLAVEVGLLIIAVELAVGLGTLLGLWTRACAVAGAVVSVLLFLSATWQVQPYFLGSDSLYAVAWLTVALVGDGGVLVARGWLPPGRADGEAVAVDPSRRVFLLRLGAGAVAVVWALALLPRSRGAVAAVSGSTPPTTAPPSPAASASGSASPGASASPSQAPQGTRIGSLADLRSSGSLPYTDPVSGDPAVVVSTGGQGVVAFDAVCTHAGCTVQYDPSQQLLVCPCHGAAFDPAHGAQVVAGPAPTPLPPLKVVVTSDGSVYTA